MRRAWSVPWSSTSFSCWPTSVFALACSSSCSWSCSPRPSPTPRPEPDSPAAARPEAEHSLEQELVSLRSCLSSVGCPPRPHPHSARTPDRYSVLLFLLVRLRVAVHAIVASRGDSPSLAPPPGTGTGTAGPGTDVHTWSHRSRAVPATASHGTCAIGNAAPRNVSG